MRDFLNLPDRLRLPVAFDPALLARDLAALSDSDWIDHFLTDRYERRLGCRSAPIAERPIGSTLC
jgi:hypothetical protein